MIRRWLRELRLGLQLRLLIVASYLVYITILGVLFAFDAFHELEDLGVLNQVLLAFVAGLPCVYFVIVFVESQIRRRLQRLARLLPLSGGSGDDIDQLENEVTGLIDALRESNNRRLRNMNNLPGIVYRCKNDKHWTMEFISQGVEAITGYSADDFLSGRVSFGENLICPEDREKAWETVQNAVAENRSYEITYRTNTKPGSACWFWERGYGVYDNENKLLALEGFITDITEMKMASDEIRTREEDLSATINSLSDAVVVCNEQGRMVRVNTVARRLVGREDHFLYAPFDEVFDLRERRAPGAPAKELKQRVAEAKPGDVIHLPLCLAKNDEESLSIALSASVLMDSKCERRGVVYVLRDVTQEEVLQEQLQQSQKMEAVGQLAGGVAHDFNNLLSVVIGYTELASSGVETGQDVSGMLNQVSEAARRAAGLTEQLLDFSRKQILKPRVFDLNANVRALREMLQHLMPPEIKIEISLAEARLHILADPGKIDQVLINLVINARDAIEGSGVVTVTTSLVEKGPAGPGVELSVRDNGSGIDSATLARVFDPFFTTKEPGKGTGLGLSVVQGIVVQSSGRIEVESSIGRGTEFRIFFPRSQSERPTTRVTERDPVSTRSVVHGLSIMLVEDDASLRELVESQLQAVDCHSRGFGVAQEAVDYLQEHSDEFDLILSDVVMPDMRGGKFALTTKELYPSLPVILMSGYPREELSEEVREVIDGFLPKPFRIDELVQAIRSVVREKPVA